MTFRILKEFRHNRIVRTAFGVSVLVVALVAQYYLTKIPRRSVDIGKQSEFSPVTVQLNQELVIEEPFVSSPEGKLFSRNPKANEVVDVHFENARLDDLTIEDLSSARFKPSLTPEPIDYGASDSKQTPGPGGPCRTFFEIELKDRKPPRALHFYQLDGDGADRRRYFEIKTGGAELVVQITTVTPPEVTNETEGCRKQLRVGDRPPLPIPPVTSIRVIAAADSAFRFTFRTLDADAKPLWEGPEGLFEPFDLGPPMVNPNDPPPFLQAREVSVRNLQNNGSNPPSLLSARSADQEPLLSVYGLKVGPDRLQIRVLGTGEMSVNGQPPTFDFLQRLETLNPLSKVIIGALNAALLAWFIGLLRNKGKAPSTKS
jgi:hypothetical protein